MSQYDDSHHDHHQTPGGPGGFSWFFQQLGWYLRKLVLWPIADSFRWFGRGIARFGNAFRYRSPLAYIGSTLAVAVTAGAVAAAVYFYKQSEQRSEPAAPVITQAPVAEPAPVPEPVQAAPPAVEPAPVPAGKDDSTLQGVVPDFDQTATTRKSTGTRADGAGPVKPGARTLVKPSPAPRSGPLKVAHRFATTFVGYEIGEKGATRKLGTTALPALSRELKRNPPRLPVNGKIPKATVMNVVRGKRKGKRLAVSVALLRTGATSELRLSLKRTPNGWRVSEVRG